MTDDELKRLFDGVRRHFDVTAEAIRGDVRNEFALTAEAIRSDVRLVAESVTVMDDRLGRRIAAVEQEMRQGFAETHAMIKFSHAELDRRLTSAENGLAELQELRERVERIEAKLDAS